MLLSEVLKKDWPEKREVCEVSSDPGICFDNNVHFYNEALTSCDREIDREALVEALWDILVTDEFLVDIDFMEEEEKLRAIRGKKNVLRRHADHIISAMPTWLKRIEK